MLGKMKHEISPSGVYFWVDVRDVALAHVLAAEKSEAQGKRFFVTAGYFSNKMIAEIIGKNFKQYAEGLPTGKALEPGDLPPEDKRPEFDNGRSVEVLGLKYRSLEESVVDTVKSLEAVSK